MKKLKLGLICFIISMLVLSTSCKKNEYKVTFIYGDDESKEVMVIEGGSATAPDPTKEGYEFICWDKVYSNVKSDLVVNALYQIKEYQVRFLDNNGNVLKEEMVKHGHSASNYNGFDTVSHKFIKWDKDYSNITSDLDIHGIYEAKRIKVEFLDINGNLAHTEYVEYGESFTDYKLDDTESHEFISWDKDLSYITKDMTVNSIYMIKQYEVKFINHDGVVVKKETVNHGEDAEGFKANDTASHKFIGWDKDYTNVTSNLEIHGIYQIKEYNVKFVDNNNNILKEEIVKHGEDAIGLTGTNTDSHIFIKWDKEFSNITSNLIVKGIYEIKKYQIKFYDEDQNTLLYTEIVEHGKDAIGIIPENKGNRVFLEWDQSIKGVTSDMSVFALYGRRSHSIYFMDGDEVIDLGINSFYEGETTVLPTYQKNGYEFLGWYLSDLSMTKYEELDGTIKTNLNLYARFLPLQNFNEITLPESTAKFTTINKGTTYQAPLPSSVPSGVTNYDWFTSDSSVATVSIWSSISAKSAGYCVLTAVNKADPSITVNAVIKVTSEGIFISSLEEANNYEICTVTFKNKDDEIIDTIKCTKGGAVIYPIPTIYEGYKFVGWDKNNYNITEDTTITALYEEGVNEYTGKSFAIIGDSISTYSGYIPEGFSCFYPYPTSDVTDVNKTWWMQAINKVGGSLFVNNSYSGSCVADSSSSATKNESRLEYTTIGGVTPDVILVYMGSNDCASKYVSLIDFNRDYKVMIENLQKLCPNSEIILCTLATSPFYTVENQIAYNEVITRYGSEYGLRVLDLTGADLTGHLVDSAHPNTSGMTIFANELVKKLLKEE